ncbi:hypothetical protein OE88DRAFT_1739458 [Heliocybe sulcata]|uniref:Uncharacterized protein n=1 Tax=Heliocybe sulcata TaxID=5364 RepID=A0A5C3MNP5_9AGAM|nr:hypothetical protein OE88DRAFT_1739458 [Heliocybe sulcata]
MQDLAIGNLCTLHFRTHLLGGARSGAGVSRRETFHATKFNSVTGRFPSKHPEITLRYIEDHEKSRDHRRCLRLFEQRRRILLPSTSGAVSGSHPQAPRNSHSQAAIVHEPLLDILSDIASDQQPLASEYDPTTDRLDWDPSFRFQHQRSHQADQLAKLAGWLKEYLLDGGAVDRDSDDEDVDEDHLDSDIEGVPVMQSRSGPLTRNRDLSEVEQDSPWYPWPNKECCVLDILRHLPRCAFSERQNSAIHWAMRMLGLHYVPTQRTMKDVEHAIQHVCGVDSIRYAGALSHVYYVNDFARLVAQELANPWVRPHLRFLPQDSGARLLEAWQGKRWLEEMDPELLTPMVRSNDQDFFIYEPTFLKNGQVCMPVCWFTRDTDIVGRVYPMSMTDRGWVVHEYTTYEVNSKDLLLAFPQLARTHHYHGLCDPCIIEGSQEVHGGPIKPWIRTTPRQGNRWRAKAQGHRVVAFPVWLYCDDTSGNVSKKWNKHNSFLFTAAGLPRRFVHREFNVHFLCTSNIAPPLEMLDGIVQQLKECQSDGVWAWDCKNMEMVLVIPSVFAMLGDNPMQSKIACHIGLMGKLFCRACWVSNGAADEENPLASRDAVADDCVIDPDVCEDMGSETSSIHSAMSNAAGTRKKAPETFAQIVDRVKRFVEIGRMRTKAETQQILASQFDCARHVGGQTMFKKQRTITGIKDTFQAFFTDKLFAISTNPVWRIKDFDPHSDTPVEILHVILLGFVKYLWRDAISCLKDQQKAVLIARLNCFNVSGLGISKLAGSTLVTYSGSLTGRDFRAVAQAAPFVLHDLLDAEAIAVWQALGNLIPMVWQPEIEDIDVYLPRLKTAIDYFLDCTCRLTPRWFNKPKFHIILHLLDHIRRFGPAMLFATEGFESYNAIIRSHSILSNHHAPSRDIARLMASSNHVRHLLCGGFFPRDKPAMSDGNSAQAPAGSVDGSPWIRATANCLIERWRSIGLAPQEFLNEQHFAEVLLRFPAPKEELMLEKTAGDCHGLGKMKTWNQTMASNHTRGLGYSNSQLFRTPESVKLVNGDACKVGDWVVWREEVLAQPPTLYWRIGEVYEILQAVGSHADIHGKANWILVRCAIVGDRSEDYQMPRVEIMDEYVAVDVAAVSCTANVQHNCVKNRCKISRSRPVYQERELTSQQSDGVHHVKPFDCILNTAQMRDAAKINPFRIPVPSLNHDTVIHAAAVQEIEVVKHRQQTQASTRPSRKGKAPAGHPITSEHVHETSVYSPNMARARRSSLRTSMTLQEVRFNLDSPQVPSPHYGSFQVSEYSYGPNA